MSFFTKLLAILCGEKEEQVISYTGPCCFDMLFTKNVPHVLEKILFSLDYESFKKCLRVSKNFNSLLNSESFQKMARRAFHKEINLECAHRLWRAAKDGKTREVKMLLKNGTLDINYEEEDWWWNHAEYFQRSYFKDPYGPLSMAAKYGHEEVVRLLLDNGADPNKANPRGRTALHVATQRGHASIVKTLIDGGGLINYADENGQTALHVVANMGKRGMYKFLVENGANEMMRDNMGWEPLYYWGLSFPRYYQY